MLSLRAVLLPRFLAASPKLVCPQASGNDNGHEFTPTEKKAIAGLLVLVSVVASLSKKAARQRS